MMGVTPFRIESMAEETRQGLDAARRVELVLGQIGDRVVACSGGIDSLVLATIAHRADPVGTVIAHTASAATPSEATERVEAVAREQRWNLKIVQTNEFDDEHYLSNPTDRCYYCKTHLYRALEVLRASSAVPQATLLSGANVDDLDDYRPGLVAAREHDVRHPWIEAGVTKSEIRNISRALELPWATLAASPCLASRLYTGTRVTPSRLAAVEAAESAVRSRTGIDTVRCRLRGDRATIEVKAQDRKLIDAEILSVVGTAISSIEPDVVSVRLDDRPYRRGAAVLGVTT